MKKILFVALLSITLFSCGDKKENQTQDTAQVKAGDSLLTVKDNNPPKDITLKYQLKQGQHFKYQLVSKNVTLQTIVADSTNSQKMEQNFTYNFDMNVQDVSDDVMDIKVNITSIKFDADAGNGQSLKYQSGTKMDSLERVKFSEFEIMLNTPFYISLDDKGEITDFYKTDKIVNNFINLQGLKDSATTEMKKQIGNNLTEGILRPLLSQIFRKLPEKNLSIDSSWSVTYPTQMPPFEITNTAKYTVKDFQKLNEDRLAVINADLSITSKGKNKVSDRGVNYDFEKPESSGSGKIYFNLTKGLIQQSKTSTKLKTSAEMSVPNSPRGPMKAKNTNYVENTYIVELL